MTVKDLIEQLSDCAQDAEVVLSGHDHGFNRVTDASYITAGPSPRGSYYEWYGPEKACHNEKPVAVVLIS